MLTTFFKATMIVFGIIIISLLLSGSFYYCFNESIWGAIVSIVSCILLVTTGLVLKDL